MSFLNKFVDYLKERKRLTVSILLGIFVICCISAVGYNAGTIFPPFPKQVDIDAQRNRLSSTCNNFSCIDDWINRTGEADLDLKEMECQLKKRYTKDLNGTMELYEADKLDKAFLVGLYSYYSHQYCHMYCSIGGPFRYYSLFLEANLQLAWAAVRNVKCGTLGETYCRWRGYKWIFSLHFSYFAIPATFVLNFINLTTLRQLFLSYRGTAQQLHFAEIVTDVLLNVIRCLHDDLVIFKSLDHWRKSCGFYRFSTVYQFVAILVRFLPSLNQAYLTGLILERLYSLSNPIKYHSISEVTMEKRGRKIIFAILFGMIVLFLPYFCMYTFSPITLYWKSYSSFWEMNRTTMFRIMATFYAFVAFVPFVIQIVAGVLVEKKYRKFSRNRTNDENEKEMKRKEGEKRMLLVGTIGLNLVTGVITGIAYLSYQKSLYPLLGLSDDELWWRIPINMANSVALFLNGNAAIIIHVVLVPSYRQAFKQTFLGRIMFRQTAGTLAGLNG